MSESDISPFEVIHSGLVRCLLSYLTATDSSGILSSVTMGSNLLGVFGSSITADNKNVEKSSPSASTVLKISSVNGKMLRTEHEFHETCHSFTFYFMKKDSKRCSDTTTPQSIHTKDESKCGSAFAFIFGVN